MKKMFVVALLVLTCLALIAAPALAQTQKDPFDPVIDPNAVTTTTTTTGTTTGSTGDPTVQPAVGSEGLANTGADVTPWLAIAYALLVVGGGALLLGRMSQPHPVRR